MTAAKDPPIPLTAENIASKRSAARAGKAAPKPATVEAQRRTYRHGDLKRALIDVAIDLARESGPAAVSLRAATRRAGVVPTAAYRHFANHQALLDEVRRVAMGGIAQSMQNQMRAAARGQKGVLRERARFRALGRGYVLYALKEPGLFRTAFWAQPYDLSIDMTQSLLHAGLSDPFMVLRAMLSDLADVGALTLARREGAEFLAWSGVHGMALLMLDGPLRAIDSRQRKALIEGVVSMVETGLTMPACPPTPPMPG